MNEEGQKRLLTECPSTYGAHKGGIHALFHVIYINKPQKQKAERSAGRQSGKYRYFYIAYKKFTHQFEGVLTGKGVGWGGSLARTEATGYGVVYITEEMLSHKVLFQRVLEYFNSQNIFLHKISVHQPKISLAKPLKKSL